MLDASANRSTSQHPRRPARSATLMVTLIAALGSGAAGAHAAPLGQCDGPCPPQTTSPPSSDPRGGRVGCDDCSAPAPKQKVVRVYRRDSYAHSTPYFNARSRHPLRAGTYIATCEANSGARGRFSNPWWSRLREGTWVNNGDLRGGAKMGLGVCKAPPSDAVVSPPIAGPQAYRLGTYNMAGGADGYGDRPSTADALVKSIKDRGADIVFLQETCSNMTNRLRSALANLGWTVEFTRTTTTRCVGPDGDAEHRSGSQFGIGIVYRSSRFTLATPKPIVHNLPYIGEPRKMLCFDFATPRPIYACSTHLTPDDDKATERLAQTTTIKQIVTPFISAGRTVFIGADLNDKSESQALNPLWDPRYGKGSNGPFVEVDSGPSLEKNNFVRDASHEEFTFGYANGRIGPFGRAKVLTKKIDYIFVRGAVVRDAEVGRSRFSDHDVLWASVMQ